MIHLHSFGGDLGVADVFRVVVFVCVGCGLFSSLFCVMCTMLPMSLDSSFLIVLSGLSNIYLYGILSLFKRHTRP